MCCRSVATNAAGCSGGCCRCTQPTLLQRDTARDASLKPAAATYRHKGSQPAHLLQVVQRAGQAEGGAVEEAAAGLKGEQEARGAHQLAAPGRQRACEQGQRGAEQ